MIDTEHEYLDTAVAHIINKIDELRTDNIINIPVDYRKPPGWIDHLVVSTNQQRMPMLIVFSWYEHGVQVEMRIENIPIWTRSFLYAS